MTRQRKIFLIGIPVVMAVAAIIALLVFGIREANAQEAPGWTLGTLKAHFDTLREDDRAHFTALRVDDQRAVEAALQAAEKAVAAALAAAKEAVIKAEMASADRFEDGNHIKEAMLDAQKNFADARLVNDLKESTTKRLDRIDATLSEMAGRTAGVGAVADNMFGIIGALAGLVAVAGFIYMLATRKRATR
jgi:hypothetical protein